MTNVALRLDPVADATAELIELSPATEEAMSLYPLTQEAGYNHRGYTLRTRGPMQLFGQ